MLYLIFFHINMLPHGPSPPPSYGPYDIGRLAGQETHLSMRTGNILLLYLKTS
jgi:hypothetical protein